MVHIYGVGYNAWRPLVTELIFCIVSAYLCQAFYAPTLSSRIHSLISYFIPVSGLYYIFQNWDDFHFFFFFWIWVVVWCWNVYRLYKEFNWLLGLGFVHSILLPVVTPNHRWAGYSLTSYPWGVETGEISNIPRICVIKSRLITSQSYRHVVTKAIRFGVDLKYTYYMG